MQADCTATLWSGLGLHVHYARSKANPHCPHLLSPTPLPAHQVGKNPYESLDPLGLSNEVNRHNSKVRVGRGARERMAPASCMAGVCGVVGQVPYGLALVSRAALGTLPRGHCIPGYRTSREQ